MEKTINEITSSIINTVRPKMVDDDWIDERDVREWVNDQRNEFARQQLSRNPISIDINFFQTENIEMKVINSSLHSSYNSGEVVLVSKNKIPTVLHRKGSTPAINKIGSNMFLSYPYRYEDSNSILQFLNGGRSFNKDTILATIDHGYLVLIAKENPTLKGIKIVTLEAVFENPLEISTFSEDDSVYPLPGNLRRPLEKKIISENFGIEIQNYSDETNDSNHELKPDTDGN